MIKEFGRSQRLAQEMQKKIAFILHHEIRDPRINNITTTISSIVVSNDLSHAKVFVTFLNDKKTDKNNSIKTLQNASGFIRFLLGKKMYLRIIPKLIFFYDDSFIKGIQISNLISKIIKYDKERHLNFYRRKED